MHSERERESPDVSTKKKWLMFRHIWNATLMEMSSYPKKKMLSALLKCIVQFFYGLFFANFIFSSSLMILISVHCPIILYAHTTVANWIFLIALLSFSPSLIIIFHVLYLNFNSFTFFCLGLSLSLSLTHSLSEIILCIKNGKPHMPPPLSPSSSSFSFFFFYLLHFFDDALTNFFNELQLHP